MRYTSGQFVFTTDGPRTVWEAFGHNETCQRWVEHDKGFRLDRSRACTCGEKELVVGVAAGGHGGEDA